MSTEENIPQFMQDQSAVSDGTSADGADGTVGEGGEYIAEETKAGVSRTTAVMFTVLALGAAGVWFMYQRSGGPSAATAAVNTDAVQAKKTINTFLDNGGQSIKSMESMLRDTQKIVQTFLTYPSMTQVPLADLRTNPFRQRITRPANAPDDGADRRRREEERLAMIKAVQSMQLQSIMYSEARKACIINNTLYKEGQTVDTFTVEKITSASVVVKSGVYRFELKMQR